MDFNKRVLARIKKYQPKGELDQTSKFFLYMVGVRQVPVKEHSERVALVAEKVAEKIGKDPKAAFFAGLLHDVGKSVLDSKLFDGHKYQCRRIC